MDWHQLLRSKWAWAGLAAAALAGGFVLYRNHGAADVPAGAGAQSSPAYSSGAVGGFDSTGTDVANWLGNYTDFANQQIRDTLGQYVDSLNASEGVAPIPTGGGGTGLPPNSATPRTPTRRLIIPMPTGPAVSVRHPPTRRT
jgi:hypothetical protein